jgi:uncharacterized membrane protein YhdT
MYVIVSVPLYTSRLIDWFMHACLCTPDIFIEAAVACMFVIKLDDQ